MTTSTYPKSEFSPEIHTPKGPPLGGDVYLHGREKRDLPVLQSRERVDQAALERRRAEERQHAAEVELAALKNRHKQELKDQEARILRHRDDAAKWDKIATGYHEDEPVEVELRANARTATMHFVRVDTGQQIDSRPMYADEVQSVIPDLEDPRQLERLTSLLRCLPATDLALALNEALSVSADEAVALLRAGQLHGWCRGGKGTTWTLTDDGVAWLSEVECDPLLEEETAVAREEAGHGTTEDHDLLMVMVRLFDTEDGTTTARAMAHELEGWTVNRAHNALTRAREKGYVSGEGGTRSKRVITEAGRDFALPF